MTDDKRVCELLRVFRDANNQIGMRRANLRALATSHRLEGERLVDALEDAVEAGLVTVNESRGIIRLTDAGREKLDKL